MLEDSINEDIFELTFNLFQVFKYGWKPKQVNYSERRLGIGPSLVLVKEDGTEYTIFHYGEFKDLLEKERDKK